MSRQVRVETRSRHQNDLKRVMHSTEKVRKWEKKWVRIEETSLQIFKWMPITKNEEQQRQQLQQQLSAPVSTETLNSASQEAGYAQQDIELKRNQEAISQSKQTKHQQHLTKPSVDQTLKNSGTSTMHVRTLDSAASIMTTTTMTSSNSDKINGSEDISKLGGNDCSSTIDIAVRPINNGETTSTTFTNTLHSNNINKRPHESNDEANESISSPSTKRVKTTADILTPTGIITNIVDNRSTVFAPAEHSVDQVPSLQVPPTTPGTPSRVQLAKATTIHLPHLAEAPANIITQQHVHPTTTTTTATLQDPVSTCAYNSDDGPKLTNANGDGDIEMMDTDETIAGDTCSVQQQQLAQQLPPPPPPTAVSNMTDALMEDFSSIVRNVTEQIVLKVSDSYGGDE